MFDGLDPLSLLWLFLSLILHTPGGLVIAARQIAAALANHDGRHGEVPVMTRSGLSAKSFALCTCPAGITHAMGM